MSIDWVTCHANYVVQIVDKLAQCAAEEGFTLVWSSTAYAGDESPLVRWSCQ